MTRAEEMQYFLRAVKASFTPPRSAISTEAFSIRIAKNFQSIISKRSRTLSLGKFSIEVLPFHLILLELIDYDASPLSKRGRVLLRPPVYQITLCIELPTSIVCITIISGLKNSPKWNGRELLPYPCVISCPITAPIAPRLTAGSPNGFVSEGGMKNGGCKIAAGNTISFLKATIAIRYNAQNPK